MAGRTVEVALGDPGPSARFHIPADFVPFVDSVYAEIDNGAGSDATPTLEIRGPNGDTVAAVPQDDVVPGGDTGRATWALRLPGKRGGGGVKGIASGLYLGGLTGSSQVIPSGVATTLKWDAILNSPGSLPIITDNPNGVTTFHVIARRVHVDLVVNFPAGNYDRYIEMNQLPNTGGIQLDLPVRNRAQITPDGDVLSLSFTAAGNPLLAANLNLVAYQASGVNQTVTAGCWLYGVPIAYPSNLWA